MPRVQLIAVSFAVGAALISMSQAAEKPLPPLKQLRLSNDVAQFGRDSNDPLALLVAARLRQGIAEKLVMRQPEQAGTPTPYAKADEVSVKTLIAEAVTMSANEPTIKALAEDLSAAASKGRVQGIAISQSTLAAGGQDKYSGMKFEGGKYAEVDIEARAGGGLGLFIYDGNENLVCRDVSASDSAYCGWTPTETASFTIKLESHSKVPLHYTFSTN